jgi:hypothetical protein
VSNIGHALVIDDKYDDGMLICAALIQQETPCYFLHYDEKLILEREERKIPKLTGIRVIFQDLALTSAGEPSKVDYDAAVVAIEAVLSETNGPWLLATWSTWAGEENDFGDEKAKEMYAHLRDNLKITQIPYGYVVLDTKRQYTTGGLHSDVKSLDQIPVDQRATLSQHIIHKAQTSPATAALIAWEKETFRAISETISEITSFIKPGDHFDSDLGCILREMALAEIGRNIAPANMKKGIREILSSILKDKIGLTIEGLEQFGAIDDQRINRLENWKAKTNRIIHFEQSPLTSPFPPGTILDISKNYDLLPGKIDNAETCGKFIRKSFFQFSEKEKNIKVEISNNCTLVALDITPPCDHAQNKSPWSRYLVGVKVPFSSTVFCNGISNGERGARLLGDYLIKLPEMLTKDKHYCFVFNSRLTFTLDNEDANRIFADNTMGRLREQILSDINSWLIRQTTRPGIVELR